MTLYEKKIAAIEEKKKALEAEIETLKRKRTDDIASAIAQMDFLDEKDLFTIIGALLHLEKTFSKEQEEAWHDAGKKFWRKHKAFLEAMGQDLPSARDQMEKTTSPKNYQISQHSKKKKA